MQLPEHAQWNDGAAARRSTRIETDVLIEVQGEGFAYAGETLRVSLHGALIRTSAPLEIGTRLRFTCIAQASRHSRTSSPSSTIPAPVMGLSSITRATFGVSRARRPTGRYADASGRLGGNFSQRCALLQPS